MYIVIDCGHSKQTAGKHSPDKRFMEYEYNRILGKMIGERLTKLGIEWCFTYPIDAEYDLSLSKRASVANQKSKIYGSKNVLLLSIHHNAASMGEWVNAEGFSVWTTNGKTISDKYANIILDVAKETLIPLGIKVRGHYEKNFTVIYKTTCPSVLVEYGFYTDKDEVEWLMSDEGLNTNADLTVKAIEQMI